jgi:hypothetical protein
MMVLSIRRAPFVVEMKGTAAGGPEVPRRHSMRYLLLIYGPEVDDQLPPDEAQAEMEAYNAFTTEVRDRGLFESGEALQPTATATSVRVSDGRTLTTDGPFAETKEALGGFYLIKARDLDEAIEVAAKIPGAKRGTIEVRPIWEFDEAGSTAGEAVGSAG